MPRNTLSITSPFIPGGNPATMNVVLPAANTPGVYADYAPGEKNQAFMFANNEWMIVTLESGATALLVGQVLFWKDRKKGIVTNVVANAVNGGTTNAWRNEVAGIAQIAIATPSTIAGNLICILVAGIGITVLASAGAVGSILVADLAANVGQSLGIAPGTAPTYFSIGVVTTAVAASVVIADVCVQNRY